MSDQALSSEAMSLLRNAAGDTGSISVPLMVGSLAAADPHIVQLLVAGYIQLRQQGGAAPLPPDRLIYDVTPAGRVAVEAME
jgi:hypothetical protein